MEETARKLLTSKTMNRLEELKKVFPDRQSVVLPVLHAIYDQLGYLDLQAIAEASEVVEVPSVYIEEAASFYTMFPLKPVGKYLIQVCHNISCTLMGADELVAYIKEKLNVEIGGTTSDNMFSLVVVECLGACGGAPMMQINDKYYEFLTREKVDSILSELREKA